MVMLRGLLRTTAAWLQRLLRKEMRQYDSPTQTRAGRELTKAKPSRRRLLRLLAKQSSRLRGLSGLAKRVLLSSGLLLPKQSSRRRRRWRSSSERERRRRLRPAKSSERRRRRSSRLLSLSKAAEETLSGCGGLLLSEEGDGGLLRLAERTLAGGAEDAGLSGSTEGGGGS